MAETIKLKLRLQYHVTMLDCYFINCFQGVSAYSVSSDQDQIKAELFKHGPIEAAFTVYADFLQYKTGDNIISNKCNF